MASKKPIQRQELSVDDPFKIITDSARIAKAQVELLNADLQATLPLTTKVLRGKTGSVADIQAQTVAMQKLNDQTAKAKKLTEDSIRLRTANERLLQTQARTQNVLLREKQANIRLNEKEQKQLNQTAGLWSKTVAEISQVTQRYRELALQKKINGNLNNKEETEMVSLYNRMGVLKNATNAVNESMGNFHHRVGQYKTGYDGLSNSFAQITREGSAFTYSMQTGFLAISNNLPIFFDEIGRAKKEIKELTEAGKPTASMFSRLKGAIFSFQTVLSVGITLLTMFGAKAIEWISSLGEGQKATEKLRKEKKILNDTMQEGVEYVAKESNEFGILIGRLKSTNAGTKERSELMNEINVQYGTTLQNMSDEVAFQGQLNEELSKFLLFKEYEFKIRKNSEYLEDIQMKRSKAQNAVYKASIELKKAKVALDKQELNYVGQITDKIVQQQDPNYQLAQAVHAERLAKYAQEKGILQELDDSYFKIGARIQDLTLKVDANSYKAVEGTKKIIEQKEKQLKIEQEIYKLSELNLEDKKYEGIQSASEFEAIEQAVASREKSIANILVIEKELALLQAKQGGNKKEIRKAEQELIDAKIKQIDKELELAVKKETNPVTIDELNKQAELAKAKLGGAEKDGTDFVKDLSDTIIEANKIIADYLEDVLQAEIDNIQDQIEKVSDNYDLLQKKAEEGNSVANESLKEQAKIMEELRQMEQERIERLAKIQAFTQVLNAGASAINGTGSAGLGSLLGGLAGFRDGTNEGTIGDNLRGKKGLSIPKLGYDHLLVRVNPNEKILNEKQSNELTGHTLDNVINNHKSFVSLMKGETVLKNTQNASIPNVIVKNDHTEIMDVTQKGFDLITKQMNGNTITKNIRKIKYTNR